MRLEITRKADLATRALLALAATSERTKSSVLAAEVGTTSGFLSQAMTPLVTAGWVRSDLGPSGGYSIIEDPNNITVLAVIEAVEGPTDTGRCVLEDRPCADQGTCALHRPWAAARSSLLRELGATTIAALQRTKK